METFWEYTIYENNIYFLISYQHIIRIIKSYILSTYYVPGFVQMSKQNRQGPYSHETCSLDLCWLINMVPDRCGFLASKMWQVQSEMLYKYVKWFLDFKHLVQKYFL